jgi:hypothetical protein
VKNLGGTYTVNAGDAEPTDLVAWDGLRESLPMTLEYQTASVTAGTFVRITLIYKMSERQGAPFQRQFLAGPAVGRLRLAGAMVRAYAELVTATGARAGAGSGTITAALTPGWIDAEGDVAVSFVMDGVTAGSDAPYQGAGFLIQAQADVTHLGDSGSPIWLYFVDANAVPAAGAITPLAPAIYVTAIGQYSFSDLLRPAAQFGAGVAWVLSSSGNNIYTPVAGALARVDLKIGV